MHEKIKFSKYQGAGNDFIIIDNRNACFNTSNTDFINKMCNRRFGIGADGLMLLQNRKGFDFDMIYYNANGKESTMCGNGGRCIVTFARDLGIISSKTDFLAVDGAHHASIEDNTVELSMIDVLSFSRDDKAYILNTGSPHYVEIVTKLQYLDVYTKGRNIRYNSLYNESGINVNFVEIQPDGYAVRTYERGVEDETLACGTGATAAAISIALEENKTGHIKIPIHALGGQLEVSFIRTDNQFKNVKLKGSAEHVFNGEIEITF